MLKANELRIGNLVSQNGFYGYVYSIESAEPRNDIRFSDKDIITLFDNGITYVPIDEIEPIPLTEEWLIKFGFELDIEDDGYFKGKYKVSVSDEGCIFFIYDNYYPIEICEFKYIHQLQNLYFALTNTELTIK